jgi:hypothetical protein
MRATEVQKPTAPAIFYIGCCMLVFILHCQTGTYFPKTNIMSNQSALTLLWSTNLFCFSVGGKISKSPFNAATWIGFVSSLANFGLSLARGACQCAYKRSG